MQTLVVLLFLVLAAFALSSSSGHTRDECIECTMRYIDVEPKDGFVTEMEIDNARARLLSWFERAGAEATPTIIYDCDFDRDGKISRADMMSSNTTCLNNPDKLERYWKYICKRSTDKDSSSSRRN